MVLNVSWKLVLIGFDEIITKVKLKPLDTCHNHCFHVGINQLFGSHKLFTEDIELAVTANEPDEDDVPIRDVVNLRQPSMRSRLHRLVVRLLKHLHRGSSLEAAVPVTSVMKLLKTPALPLEGFVVLKPLSAKKLAIVGIVEAFNGPVSPGFPDGDEDWLYPIGEA